MALSFIIIEIFVRKLIISIIVKLLAFSEVMVKESNKYFKFLKGVFKP